MLGDLPLLCFGMLTFTFSGSAFITFIEPVGDGERWISLFASILLFLMLYPPSRLIFTVEEWLVKQISLNRIMTIVFFIATMLGALQEISGLF